MLISTYWNVPRDCSTQNSSSHIIKTLIGLVRVSLLAPKASSNDEHQFNVALHYIDLYHLPLWANLDDDALGGPPQLYYVHSFGLATVLLFGWGI